MDRTFVSGANDVGSNPAKDAFWNGEERNIMRLWIDDIREPPNNTWTWAKTESEALVIVKAQNADNPIEAVSFDHDLGGTEDTRSIVLYMAEHNVFPPYCWVHSMNPIGAKYLRDTINRYGPGVAPGSAFML